MATHFLWGWIRVLVKRAAYWVFWYLVRDLKRWPGCSAGPPLLAISPYLHRYVVQELRSKSHRLCTRSTLRSICDLSDFGHASVLRGGRVGFLDGIGSELGQML